MKGKIMLKQEKVSAVLKYYFNFLYFICNVSQRYRGECRILFVKEMHNKRFGLGISMKKVNQVYIY